MATVVGKTSSRIDELLAGLVTNVEISSAGRLIVTFRGGSVSDLGPVGLKASDVSYAGATGMTGTNVESALDELASSRAIVGEIKMWPGATAPANYLFCRGQTFQSTQYPELAAILGDTYGTHTGTTYFLPNFNARSPIGVGGTNGKAGNVNNYALGLKWGDERLQAHNHGGGTGISDRASYGYGNVPEDVYAQGYGAQLGGGYGGRIMIWDFTTGLTHNHTIPYDGAGDMGNVHPVLGINFIIKAA